ncbi:PAS domain S-box protein [Halobacterium jilantaiense]|uniref:PAS domain S-box-containing protein n=1 Tax=Halobacterium jilantaiense TaxID=355548 RepID=A0A1I0PF93_9EURY|nr:PAS domain S-box protein [Halobacterium jilantaiense]SEW13001.1 PAS domain S-box-containing protein [Halobacterium jilantaiense]
MGQSLSAGLRETLSVFEVAGEPRTTPEVADALDLGRRTAYARLERLVEADALATKKVGASARVWWRPAADGTDDALTTQWEHQFRSLVEATDEYAIFLLDADGHVQTWNPGAERIKGYDAADILGEHFSAFYTESDRADDVPARNLRAAAELGSVQDEGWRLRADGSRFWANVTITAIREDDDLAGFAKVTRDMTEHRLTERRLREEKSFVESLLDTQQDLFYAFDDDLEPLRWSDDFEAITGYDPAEIESMTPRDFVADDAAAAVENAIDRIFAGERVSFEAPLETADGEQIPYEFTGGPITDDVGEVVGFTGAGRDVSERKVRERRLEQQHDELQAELADIFTQIGEAFFALDDDARITYVNHRAADLVGLSPGELLGARTWDVLPETADGRVRDRIESALADGSPAEFEFHSELLDRWLEVRAYPAEEGLSVYVRDVSERTERERELELYEAVIDTVEDGIYVLDEEFCFVEVNDAFVSMTGYDREALLGSHTALVVGEEVAAEATELRGDIADSDGGSATMETDVRRADGSRVRVESRFTTIPGEDTRHVGVARDVSERVEREQELRRRVSQQQVVADLGQRALQNSDLDALLAEAAEVVADTLDTDYCKVLDLDADELLLRQGVGWDRGIVGEASVSAVENASQAAVTLDSEEPVIVEHLAGDARIDGPELLTSHDVESGISTIVGPVDDPWGILGAHDTDRREFSEHDATFVQSVANVLAAAIERHGYENELVYQREQLGALNSLNEVVRDISSAVIEQSTRAEIEATVCERLAGTGSYAFAWTGEVDPATQRVEPRAQAGVEGYLDDITLSVDPDDELSEGATGRALRTGEIQVTNDIAADDRYEPWRESVEAYGFRSSAAVPITHEGTTYGVLNVYTERPSAFEGQEHAVIAQLGEVVGHAIAATERKRALMSDELVELEFQVEGFFEALDVGVGATDPITIDHAVPVGDGEFLVYGSAAPVAMDAVRTMAESMPHWRGLTVRGDDDAPSFEVRVSDPPVLSTVASLGGYVDGAVIEGGDLRITVHLAPTVDARTVIDSVTETYPNAEMLRRRQITRVHESPQPLPGQLLDELTDRQRAAVEAAYHAGFFEWPRDASGEEVAASLDVSPPTFHQHLRKAERKLFESLLAAPVGDPDATAGGTR